MPFTQWIFSIPSAIFLLYIILPICILIIEQGKRSLPIFNFMEWFAGMNSANIKKGALYAYRKNNRADPSDFRDGQRNHRNRKRTDPEGVQNAAPEEAGFRKSGNGNAVDQPPDIAGIRQAGKVMPDQSFSTEGSLRS